MEKVYFLSDSNIYHHRHNRKQTNNRYIGSMSNVYLNSFITFSLTFSCCSISNVFFILFFAVCFVWMEKLWLHGFWSSRGWSEKSKKTRKKTLHKTVVAFHHHHHYIFAAAVYSFIIHSFFHIDSLLRSSFIHISGFSMWFVCLCDDSNRRRRVESWKINKFFVLFCFCWNWRKTTTIIISR